MNDRPEVNVEEIKRMIKYLPIEDKIEIITFILERVRKTFELIEDMDKDIPFGADWDGVR